MALGPLVGGALLYRAWREHSWRTGLVSGTLVAADHNMSRLNEKDRANPSNHKKSQANVQLYMVRQEGRSAKEERIAHPDDQEQREEYQLSGVTEGMLSILFFHRAPFIKSRMSNALALYCGAVLTLLKPLQPSLDTPP